MEANWVEISEETYKVAIRGRNCSERTVGFCSPPLTFVWDNQLPRGTGWEQYEYAAFKIQELGGLPDDKRLFYFNLSVVKL